MRVAQIVANRVLPLWRAISQREFCTYVLTALSNARQNTALPRELFATIERMLGDKLKPEYAELATSLPPLIKL